MNKSKSCVVIGKKCKKAREKQNLTQEQVARQIDVTLQTYRNFETGRNHSTKCLDWFMDNMGVKL